MSEQNPEEMKPEALAKTKNKLTALNRYPVKSFAGESLSVAKILKTGIIYDRHWMMVDENAVFMSQRKFPKMALLKASVQTSKQDHEQFTIDIPEQQTIDIELNSRLSSEAEKLMDVSVWKDFVTARTMSVKCNDHLSKYMEKPVSLVEMSEQHPRAISDEAAEGIVSFADAFPFLLIGSASLTHLNKQLSDDNKVNMDNFRPNFVVETELAHEEDRWDVIKIGEVTFKNVKLCSRCILTTINPQTSALNKQQEPLTSLATYRVIDGKIMFGCNLIALNEGRVSVDDVIEIVSYKDQNTD